MRKLARGVRALLALGTALAMILFAAGPATAYTVTGAIGAHYSSLGGASGRLGAPLGNQHCGLRDGGCYQSFQGGSIHWSPASGAHATWGSVRSAWARTGWENGPLGYPTTNKRCGLPDGGCYQTFQSGSVHSSPATGAHASWGAIRAAWRETGWERGRLGYPTSDEYPSAGGRAQKFQHGTITWRSGAGTTVQLSKPPGSFTLKGSGFGHGVGMSQYGARAMASTGSSATTILQHYYRPAVVESVAASANADVRVQLLNSTKNVTITPNSGMLRVRAGTAVDDSWTPVTISRTSDNRVRAQVGASTYTASAITIEWQNTRYWPGGTKHTYVSIPGARAGATGSYRHGRLEVGVQAGSLNVVNALRLNTEYLRGIAEMPTGWHREALKAQAIAARTYAYRSLGTVQSACACNLYDEVRSQVFAGWNHEAGPGGANWVAAVNATQKLSGSSVTSAQVVRYKGALISALYSSSSGGTTNRAADVFGTDTPYLQQRSDAAAYTAAAGNPYTSWTVSISQAAMSKAFGLSNVVDLQITRTGSGMVKTITATSSAGKRVTKTGPAVRSALGLRSATFRVVW